jgi:YegS/Rv2252/BmrU family lipid kinase
MADQTKISEDKWLIIVNPNAGARKGAKDWSRISEYLNEADLPHICVLTEHRDHANKITMEFIEKGFRNIAVVGGDGTMNEVVNGIFMQKEICSSDITLGMIPVGTGNDWSRMFGIPFDYKGAIEILKKKKTFMQDVGKIQYFKKEEPHVRYFMNIAGMGYDALVAKKANLSKEKGKGGPLSYFVFIFTGLLQYKFVDAVIEIDDQQVFKGEIFSMNVGICKYSGGGMIQVPFAIPDDGLFDITLIKKAPKWLVIRYANKLYDGTLVNLDFVNTFKGKNVRIRSTGKLYLEADGESLGNSPFVYEILPKSLRIVTGL